MRSLRGVAIAALVLASATGSAHGATAPSDAAFITIDRPVRDVAIEPGATVVEVVTIKNQTPRAVDVVATTRDLAVRAGNSRSPKFAAAGSQPRGAGAWIDVQPAKLRVAAGREATVRLAITAPTAADAGAWQGAAVLSVTGVGGAGNVGITQELPVVLLAGVAGDARRDLRVSITPERRLRLRGGRAIWAVEIRNEGDVHESFGGRVVVDGRTGARRTLQLEPGILLPGERRRQQVALDLQELPDIVDARAEVDARGRAGDQSRPVDERRSAVAAGVWLIPWWLPLVVFALVVVIVVRVRRRRTRVGSEIE